MRKSNFHSHASPKWQQYYRCKSSPRRDEISAPCPQIYMIYGKHLSTKWGMDPQMSNPSPKPKVHLLSFFPSWNNYWSHHFPSNYEIAMRTGASEEVYPSLYGQQDALVDHDRQRRHKRPHLLKWSPTYKRDVLVQPKFNICKHTHASQLNGCYLLPTQPWHPDLCPSVLAEWKYKKICSSHLLKFCCVQKATVESWWHIPGTTL